MREMKRRAINGEIVLPVVLFALTTAYLIEALSAGRLLEGAVPSVAFFPLTVSLVMYVALAVVLAGVVKGLRQEGMEGGKSQNPRRLKNPLLVVLGTMLYIALFDVLGYVLATLPYVYGILTVFRFGDGQTVGGQVRRIIATILITAAFYAFFVIAFNIRLPSIMEAF